jgi:quinohemoprotein ethanol dehydrogenase
LLSNSGSNAPDLRESAAILDLDTMKAILHDGVLLPNGMPQFKDLNDEEILAISEYARQVICDTKPRLRLANQ